MRKFRACVVILLSVGVLSMSATACGTEPPSQRQQEYLMTSIGNFFTLIAWVWMLQERDKQCPGCPF